ncbi:Helicase C-terminal domain-containing protein [Mycena indigotica]|uniref:Helicase C-terminal domain-containing protein n=1 Tax=Mycena indigotica TaxID=2126181 RepID=A0A8H6W9P4_9AGAR|nr:Helicase C-terminal domain-containing protein [Mycena indigotica]KAF7309902.1 Helicase C-terminal domain-containing protein [Mycena indigotica]
MAKGKEKTSKPAGQQGIKSFFKKTKPSKGDDADFEGGNGVDHDASESDDNDAPATSSKPEKGESKIVAPDESDLPPIHDISAIFDDLVSRIPKIKKVAEHIQGRKLRVATMCSGTESPLLALELIQKSIFDQHNIKFDVEHVFSCEIEPFKQAYIERNFRPPILFRDVCELGNAEAHTAYGALVPVPGDVDILVAGTSCVDYSNLNNQKQDIEAKGESGQTFRGMLGWVKLHRPPIVILENVCSAPWPKVVAEFEKIDYSATSARFDTKFYYIAHTRTRVYLVAVDAKRSDIPDQWLKIVSSDLKRPASSSLDAFLLPSDDPRIHVARQKLAKESYNSADRRTGRTDWNRCERRHERSRAEEELGKKRPLTNWDEGGSCSLPDYSWSDWGVGQVERVWDLMDILTLRSAKKGIDPSYKTQVQVWNLSQNVDRTVGANKLGICPCLTPSMIPFITNRGGPMVGLEALAMQGLPIDKLLLTRETEDQLADLAGNAMSTTVVGACILAALTTGMRLLKNGKDDRSYESKRGMAETETTAMDVDIAKDTLEDHVVGEDELVTKPLDLAVTSTIPLSDLIANANQSSRLCDCEGRTDITTRKLSRCQDCGASSCTKCGGRPEHNPVEIDTNTNPRLAPSEFADQIKSTLPMTLNFGGLSEELLDALADGESIAQKLWSPWRDAVLRIPQAELRFVEPKRQDIWIASYESPQALLELHLHPQQPEWRLYAKADPSAPAKAEIRHILKSPVGRLRCTDSLLSGSWELALPKTNAVSVSIQGAGEPVPSWEMRLGLTGDDYKDKKVMSQLKVSVSDEDLDKFDRDISGVYTLLDKCGTANGALHKKEATTEEANLPPLFLLLHPQRTSDDDDCFVFSISRRRYEYGESRPIVAVLDSKWRQSNSTTEKSVKCRVPVWKSVAQMSLSPSHAKGAQYGVPERNMVLDCSKDSCGSAAAVLMCSVPLGDQAGPEWPRDSWGEVDKVHERSIFRSLAWLLERVRHISNSFDGSWQNIELPHDEENCKRCAPTPPEIQWVSSKKKMIALEEPHQAGEYERRLKIRPSPFVTQLKLGGDGVGTVKVGFNAPTLVHRAFSRLPTLNRTEPATVSWRLNTNFTPAITQNLPKFQIKSNKQDVEHRQPPSFKVKLRKEQRRSLSWMVQQEAIDVAPFIEEEISEAILPSLGWRAEGRAQRPVRVRGGVLADAVGYGKTATTLGLIDCTADEVEAEFEEMGRIPGKILTKATLVVVPPHLTKQWQSEAKKFTANRFEVLVIPTVTHLNPLTIQDFQEADIVVIASTLSKSQAYTDNLELLAGNGTLPASAGRHFNARLKEISEALKSQTDRLQDEGSAAVLEEMKRGEQAAAEAEAAARVVTKRLKGQAYRDAQERLAAEKKGKEQAAQKRTTPAASPSASSSRSSSQVSVVVPLLPGHKLGQNMQLYDGDAMDVDDEEEVSRAPRRAAAKRTIIVLSDDEDEKPKPKKAKGKAAAKSKAASKKNGKGKKKSGTDDDDYSAEETPSEDDYNDEDETSSIAASSDQESEDSDSPAIKTGSKRKAPTKKVTAKSRKSSVASTPSARESADDESEDEEPKGKKKKAKRKAGSDDEDAVGAAKEKRKSRLNSDPWKLGSNAVKKDWRQMKAPPLEMFHFARMVVDEYTYLDGRVHPLITNLTSERHWVLSGTPPVHDFAALKTISAFLGLHLGVDDDGEGQSVEVKKRRREQTDAEKFHSFREVHSLEWHANRHTLGQRFLDQFVRQNVPEIDEIPFKTTVTEIVLPAAERAIYLELEHHLRALDMTIKRGRKTESDREKRLALSLGESKTAEEALLKRCSHFELDAENENAMKACDVIVKEREKQLEACKAELLRAVKAGVKREIALGHVPEESHFSVWVRASREEGVQDADATKIILEVIDQTDAKTMKSKRSGKEVTLTGKVKDAIWEHREATHEIRRLSKELVGRVRSLRFFTAVRDLQKQRDIPIKVSCPACGRERLDISDISVLSSCGHMGCSTCVRDCAEKEECVYAASGKCSSAARILNIVKGDTLGIDDEERDGRGKHYGKKLEVVIDLIKNQLPKDDRVLVFVQFPDLMKKVAAALKDHKVKYLEIKGSASAKSKALESFQHNSAERVLLLNLMDESASGANLTSANHAIFLSPLLAQSQEQYDACMTQAVGRLVRFGQTKVVHIWRYCTNDTMDGEIYNLREPKLLLDAAEHMEE